MRLEGLGVVIKKKVINSNAVGDRSCSTNY